MKRYLIKCVIMAVLLLVIAKVPPVMAAEKDFSDVYVAISDAKSTLQDKNQSENAKKQSLDQVNKAVADLNIDRSKEGKDVTSALKALDRSGSTEKQTAQLSELTKSLIAYENTVNQTDNTEEIKTLQSLIDKQNAPIKKAIEDSDQEKLKQINGELNSIWTKHESVIRNKNVDQYGQIEVYLMQLRVAIEKEPLNTQKVESSWQSFKTAIDQADQVATSKGKGKYHATDLNTHLDKAIQAIDQGDLDKADQSLSQFIKTWPYVEGQIQTKNISLYNKIENRIPYYQSILDDKNKDDVKKELTSINKDIAETVGKQGYTSWDVMLIFLREGLEVLLIVMTLTTMTRQMKDRKGTASVLSGAVTGLIISLLLAFLFISLLGDSGVLREGMEATLGLVAVFLMYIVGIWMHQRSNAKRWDEMMQSMYHNAIQNRNLLLLGVIGFITVLREGVEVIVFYMGMVGNITAVQFTLGIVYALVILTVFALLYRFIVKLIPIYYIFKFLSLILFVMAFKMLGMSIQKLQLLDIVPRHGLEHVPTLSWIGFYPTIETIVAQVIFIIFVVLIYTLRSNKK
ncbi:FTR1 family protein [Staphylococcus cornubiensis]|uniref:FTR1 family protein n=1 Tax=Staphylococcus cornubiensis TaxID=1986155 RepID=UPI000A3758B8|nr:FTR1 family protein [Staphylococcus cornubiensis]